MKLKLVVAVHCLRFGSGYDTQMQVELALERVMGC